MTATSETVRTDLDEDGVLLLTLNRPDRKNAFNDEQWDATAAALRAASEDRRVAVVVLTGAGGNFSSGVDLAAFQGDPAPRADGYESAFHAFVPALFAFNKPLIAAVQGVSVGGGATIPLACDFVYAGESLRMRLPFANLGLVPEIGSSYTLSAAIGRQRAAEIMLSAEWIDADRALELGLVARVVPDVQLLEQTLVKARQIAQWPTSSLCAIKATLRTAHQAALDASIAFENEAMSRLAGSPENIEAVTAFMQKRKPDFKQFRKND